MRKFFALFRNEMTKITHRVLILVGLIALLIVPLLATFSASRTTYYYDEWTGLDPNMSDQDYADEQVRLVEEEFAAVEEMHLDMTEEGIIDYYSRVEYESVKVRLEVATRFRDTNPEAFRIVYMSRLLGDYSWQQGAYNTYLLMVEDADGDALLLQDAEYFLEDYTRTSGKENIEGILAAARTALDTASFDDYVEYRYISGGFDNNQGLASTSSDAYRALWDKVSIDDAFLKDRAKFNLLESTIEAYMERDRSLELGIDQRGNTMYSDTPVTPQIESVIEKEMLVLLYQIENNKFIGANNGITMSYLQPSATRAFNNSFTMNFLILLIGMMILSASTVSQEIETGTIKALIISPTKRWKIILAKFCALVATMLGLFIISNLWITLLNALFFGAGNLPGLVTTVGDTVFAFGWFTAPIVRMLIYSVQLIVFIVVAMVFSTVIRHTAIAVGLSIGVFFTNLIAQLVLMASSYQELYKFLPFFNIDFSGRIGASLPDYLFGGYFGSHYQYISPLYSVIYTLVLVGLLLWITFDSFIRRDI